MDLLVHLLSFRGRIGRAEFAVVLVGAVAVAIIGSMVIGRVLPPLTWLLTDTVVVIFAISIGWVVIAAYWKRMHDLDERGNARYFAYVPLVGFVVLLIVPGVVGANTYGARRRFFESRFGDPLVPIFGLGRRDPR